MRILLASQFQNRSGFKVTKRNIYARSYVLYVDLKWVSTHSNFNIEANVKMLAKERADEKMDNTNTSAVE